MTQESQRETTPDRPATSFAQHVRAFHRSLPIEEQRMLEEVFALAEMVASQGQDVSGYDYDGSQKFMSPGTQPGTITISPSLTSSFQFLKMDVTGGSAPSGGTYKIQGG